MNTKLKDIKITYGPHQYNFTCNSCIAEGLITEANLPITTLLTIVHSDGKGGWLPPTYHCVAHCESALNEVKKGILRDYQQSGEGRKFVDYFNEKKVK